MLIGREESTQPVGRPQGPPPGGFILGRWIVWVVTRSALHSTAGWAITATLSWAWQDLPLGIATTSILVPVGLGLMRYRTSQNPAEPAARQRRLVAVRCGGTNLPAWRSMCRCTPMAPNFGWSSGDISWTTLTCLIVQRRQRVAPGRSLAPDHQLAGQLS